MKHINEKRVACMEYVWRCWALVFRPDGRGRERPADLEACACERVDAPCACECVDAFVPADEAAEVRVVVGASWADV